MTFPPNLLARAAKDPVVANLLDGEQRLFTARVHGREGQKAQMRERIAQLRQEIQGLKDQGLAKEGEIALISTS